MSKAYRIGNIFTRIEGLIRKNHLKENDIPLWFDVYKRFPPKYNPKLNRLEPDIKINEILYKEDIIRSKIHKAFLGRLGVFDLQDDKESVSQTTLKSCMDLISQGMSEDEAIEKLKASFKRQDFKKEINPDTEMSLDNLKSILEVPSSKEEV